MSFEGFIFNLEKSDFGNFRKGIEWKMKGVEDFFEGIGEIIKKKCFNPRKNDPVLPFQSLSYHILYHTIELF